MVFMLKSIGYNALALGSMRLRKEDERSAASPINLHTRIVLYEYNCCRRVKTWISSAHTSHWKPHMKYALIGIRDQCMSCSSLCQCVFVRVNKQSDIPTQHLSSTRRTTRDLQVETHIVELYMNIINGMWKPTKMDYGWLITAKIVIFYNLTNIVTIIFEFHSPKSYYYNLFLHVGFSVVIEKRIQFKVFLAYWKQE